MAMESVSAAGGNIEIMFLQQMGDDPFISTPERTAQIGGVAGRIARFISEAHATLDISQFLGPLWIALVGGAHLIRLKNDVTCLSATPA
jgi:hypothetical protein